MSIVNPGTTLSQLVQTGYLVRKFGQALYPNLLFRMEAKPIPWEAGVGETKTWTRAGLLPTVTEALAPGAEATPENSDYEKWITTCELLSGTTDTNLTQNHMVIADKFVEDTIRMGEQAGKSVNQRSRDALFRAYATGHTIVDVGVVAGTTFTVASISGFTNQLLNTNPDPVSVSNPKAFLVNGVAVAQNIIGVQPLDANFPLGAGTVTVDANITIATGDTVKAADAPHVIRPNGALGIDALGGTDVLTLQLVQRAVAILRSNSVPTHMDGTYHVHLSPSGENQLFGDTVFQTINEGAYKDTPYQNFVVNRLVGCTFFRNELAPSAMTAYKNMAKVQTSRPTNAADARLDATYGAEVVNASGLSIMRTVVTGRGALYECWVDQMAF
ncbi:MAG: hypothetical protein ACPG77_16260, partial [Nannocystaceae bacterium]